MPRIENSQLGQPQEGNIQLIVVRPLDGSPALYLEIPIAHLASLCIRPRKYLRYLGWCIVGVEGRVARDSPQPVNDIKDEGELESGSVYSYQIPEVSDQLLEHAVNMDAFNARSTPSGNSLPSQVAQDLQLFRQSLEPRDVRCIMSCLFVYNAFHIIPYAQENAWINVIIHSRPNNNEDVTGLTINDVRNGMLVSPTIHACLGRRQIAFLKTPNPVLNNDDIQTNNDRLITPGTGYPEGERFTLQLIEILDDFERSIAVEICGVGQDAAFSSGTHIAKPSGVLLHYNYGAAAVKWWGHHTDVLRSPGPPHPPPPPPPPRRSQRRLPPPAPGPSTAGPSYHPRPRPNFTNDRIVSIKKREGLSSKSRARKKKGVQRPSAVDVADEPINEPKVWESWDEDDWMFYFMLNTKAARERHQAAKEESASNIKAWAQEVSGHQSAEL